MGEKGLGRVCGMARYVKSKANNSNIVPIVLL